MKVAYENTKIPIADPVGTGSFEDLERKLVENQSERKTQDVLTRHITQLLSLHPEIPLKFREVDLDKMDEETKKTLISDLNDALDIHIRPG